MCPPNLICSPRGGRSCRLLKGLVDILKAYLEKRWQALFIYRGRYPRRHGPLRRDQTPPVLQGGPFMTAGGFHRNYKSCAGGRVGVAEKVRKSGPPDAMSRFPPRRRLLALGALLGGGGARE